MRVAKTTIGSIWIPVVALLFFFGLRLRNIDALPLFIDETIAIGWTQDVANDILLQHTRDGKLTLPYYLLPFQPHLNAPLISRISLVVLTCLGLASEFAIARRIAGHKAALLTLALVGFSPMLIFLTRLVLADTLLRVAISLWVLCLIHLFDHSRLRYTLAIASGAAFVLALSAKAPSLFLLPLPIVAILAYKRWTSRDRLKALALFYGTVIVLWLPMTVALVSRQINYFDKSDSFLPAGKQLLDLSRIAGNLSQLLDTLVTYHGALFVVAVALLASFALWLKPRLLLTPLACFIGFEFAVAWLGIRISYLRYFMPVVPMLFVSAGIAIVLIHRSLSLQLQRFAYLDNARMLTGLDCDNFAAFHETGPLRSGCSAFANRRSQRIHCICFIGLCDSGTCRVSCRARARRRPFRGWRLCRL